MTWNNEKIRNNYCVMNFQILNKDKKKISINLSIIKGIVIKIISSGNGRHVCSQSGRELWREGRHQ